MLADGAMATSLFTLGLRSGDPPEGWNAVRPEAVRRVHRTFAAAGAEVLLTNSFGGHPLRLALSGLEGRVAELNGLAVDHARAAAAAADRPVAVAGVIGPTGLAELPAEAAGGFIEQARALRAGGADLLWIETMSFAAEMRVAAAAAASVGLPYVMTASFDRGRTLGGLLPADVATLAAGFPVPPIALGSNCGSGPEGVLADLAALRLAAPAMPIVAKANAGLPDMRDGRLHYTLTREAAGAYARAAVEQGAMIVGGCCGTTPEHTAAMAEALATPPAGF